MTVDFEAALMAAITDEFPAADLHGCYFHFTQAVWRKIQFLGLVHEYAHNPSLMTACRRLMALPFLPEGEIQDTFELIVGGSNGRHRSST